MVLDKTPTTRPRRDLARSRRKAPGPVVNQYIGYQRDQPKMTMDLQRRYGDIVRYRIGPLLVHQVTHPDLIRQVLLESPHDYRRGPFYEGFRVAFGDGLLTTDGEQWRRHRTVSRSSFHPRRIQDMSPAVTDVAVELVERFRRAARQDGGFDLVGHTMWYTIEVLGRCLFTDGLGHTSARMAPAVQTGLELIIQRMNPAVRAIPRWVPTRHNIRLRRTLGIVEPVLEQVLEEHRSGTYDDLVSRHLEASEGSGPRLLTRREVRDGLMTTFLAGHETTGTSLAWTLWVLATQPAIRQAVEDEVDSVLGGRPATTDDLPNLPYTRMVVEESLRMYPPIWLFPRGVAQETQIGGYDVPVGSTIFMSPYVTHRHPEFWDDPETFDPERFRPEAVAGRDRHAYLPFGFGQRQCIGKHIALLQLQVAVATLAQELRFELIPGRAPVSYRPKVSLRPRQGSDLRLLVTARDRAAA